MVSSGESLGILKRQLLASDMEKIILNKIWSINYIRSVESNFEVGFELSPAPTKLPVAAAPGRKYWFVCGVLGVALQFQKRYSTLRASKFWYVWWSVQKWPKREIMFFERPEDFEVVITR